MDLSTRRTHLDQPRGHVLIAHGYGEHSGRFEGLSTALLNAGYDVSTYDHYGHGTSPGPRAQVDAKKFWPIPVSMSSFFSGIQWGVSSLRPRL